MNLLIENGILLKPHSLRWTPKGYTDEPPGWTPDRLNRYVQEFADNVMTDNPDGSREFALRQAEQAHGRLLYKRKLKWRGWVPVDPRKGGIDKRISDAYRAYFVASNPQIDTLPLTSKRLFALMPKDGRYRFKRGKMTLVELFDNGTEERHAETSP